MTDTGSSVVTTDREPQPAAGGRGRKGPGRVGPALYYRQIVAELRKVIWPTRPELITYTAVALVFVTAMVIIITIFDIVFAKGVLEVFG